MNIRKSKKDLEIEIKQLKAQIDKIKAQDFALNKNVQNKQGKIQELDAILSGQKQMIEQLELENKKLKLKAYNNEQQQLTFDNIMQMKNNELNQSIQKQKSVQAQYDFIKQQLQFKNQQENDLLEQIQEYKEMTEILQQQIKMLSIKQKENEAYEEKLLTQLQQQKGFQKENKQKMELSRIQPQKKQELAESQKQEADLYDSILRKYQHYNYRKLNDQLTEPEKILEALNSIVE